MTEMFSTLGTWNWLIFGLILMALELLAPGVFLFWLGLAALLVGLLSFALSLSWQLQILMFAIFAAAAVPLWRHFARRNASVSASNSSAISTTPKISQFQVPSVENISVIDRPSINPLWSHSTQLNQTIAFFSLSMISSENRFPRFRIMF